MEQLKQKFNEIAGNWNGDDVKGEDRALAAQDILDLIDTIEMEEKDILELQDDLEKDKQKLEVLVKEYDETYGG